MRQLVIGCFGLIVLAVGITPLPAQSDPPKQAHDQGIFGRHLADYNSELRRRDGRVDIEATAARLKELGVTAYYWLTFAGPSDARAV